MVKCRVLGADPGRKGLKLSLVTKKKAAAGAAEEAAAEPEAAAAEGKPAKTAGAAAAANGAEAGLGDFQPGDVVRGTVTALHTKEVSRGWVRGGAGRAGVPAEYVGGWRGYAWLP